VAGVAGDGCGKVRGALGAAGGGGLLDVQESSTETPSAAQSLLIINSVPDLIKYRAVCARRCSMPIEASRIRYSAVAQSLHWIIAALIATQFTLAWMAEDLPLGMHKLALLARHKSFGMTVLMLAVLRLVWRLFNPAPPLPGGMSAVETFLARATHFLFYLLLFAMPLTGWLMSSAKNYSVSWFGLFTWPDLVGPNDHSFEILKTTHWLLSNVLFAIAILHILAALKHHFWNKDDVLKRMLPFTKTEKGS